MCMTSLDQGSASQDVAYLLLRPCCYVSVLFWYQHSLRCCSAPLTLMTCGLVMSSPQSGGHTHTLARFFQCCSAAVQYYQLQSPFLQFE